jgi:hypothetical protein
MGIPILKIWNKAKQQYESILAIKGDKGDTPQKGVDYFTDADKQELVNDVITSISNDSNVVVYTSPTNPVPIKNGSQVVFYVNQVGTVTLKIGNATYTVNIADVNECVWFIWLQSTTTGGSIIRTDGARKWMNVGGIAENILFSYSGTGSLIVGVMG